LAELGLVLRTSSSDPQYPHQKSTVFLRGPPHSSHLNGTILGLAISLFTYLSLTPSPSQPDLYPSWKGDQNQTPLFIGIRSQRAPAD
jgi:hypothetical protein